MVAVKSKKPEKLSGIKKKRQNKKYPNKNNNNNKKRINDGATCDLERNLIPSY